MVAFTKSRKKLMLFGLAFVVMLASSALAINKQVRKKSVEEEAKRKITPLAPHCPLKATCNCCFNDELSFGSMDMYKLIDDQIFCCPDRSCMIGPKDVRSWLYVPDQSINWQFQIPRDLDTSKNVQVELHFTVTGDLTNTVTFPVALSGVFAGQCTFEQFCFVKCFEIPCVGNFINQCAHFVVSFCINPLENEFNPGTNLLNPGEFGLLCIEPLELGCLFPPNIALSLVASSFRYHKKESKNKQVCTDFSGQNPCTL